MTSCHEKPLPGSIRTFAYLSGERALPGERAVYQLAPVTVRRRCHSTADVGQITSMTGAVITTLGQRMTAKTYVVDMPDYPATYRVAAIAL